KEAVETVGSPPRDPPQAGGRVAQRRWGHRREHVRRHVLRPVRQLCSADHTVLSVLPHRYRCLLRRPNHAKEDRQASEPPPRDPSSTWGCPARKGGGRNQHPILLRRAVLQYLQRLQKLSASPDGQQRAHLSLLSRVPTPGWRENIAPRWEPAEPVGTRGDGRGGVSGTSRANRCEPGWGGTSTSYPRRRGASYPGLDGTPRAKV